MLKKLEPYSDVLVELVGQVVVDNPLDLDYLEGDARVADRLGDVVVDRGQPYGLRIQWSTFRE